MYTEYTTYHYFFNRYRLEPRPYDQPTNGLVADEFYSSHQCISFISLIMIMSVYQMTILLRNKNIMSIYQILQILICCCDHESPGHQFRLSSRISCHVLGDVHYIDVVAVYILPLQVDIVLRYHHHCGSRW